MSRSPANLTAPKPARRGFTLVESVISIGIAGGLLVVALNTAGAAKFGQYKTGQRQRGLLLRK